MVGDETELKKEEEISQSLSENPISGVILSVRDYHLLVGSKFYLCPYLVVVGFYESRYHAYVQMNDLAGHNYAVIIDYRSLSATVH